MAKRAASKASASGTTVKCEACGHSAELSESTPSTWKCNCHAGVGAQARTAANPDGCECDHTNVVEQAE